MIDDNSFARVMFSGWGRPCANIVDSRATTGLLEARASDTSGSILKSDEVEFVLAEDAKNNFPMELVTGDDLFKPNFVARNKG